MLDVLEGMQARKLVRKQEHMWVGTRALVVGMPVEGILVDRAVHIRERSSHCFYYCCSLPIGEPSLLTKATR